MDGNDLLPEWMSGIADVDRTIHEPSRLLLVAQLYVVEEADCLFLLRQTNLTWGNLNSHLSKLEQAGYVAITKGFVGKKPRTIARLTQQGRQAFDAYRQVMGQFVSGVGS